MLVLLNCSSVNLAAINGLATWNVHREATLLTFSEDLARFSEDLEKLSAVVATGSGRETDIWFLYEE